MKPQNFLLENLKFANVEEFSKKRLEIVAVEDFFFGNIGNCGRGRNFQRKDRKLWMWQKFSSETLETVDVGQKSELLTVVTAHLILATTHNICISFIFHPFPLKFASL